MIILNSFNFFALSGSTSAPWGILRSCACLHTHPICTYTCAYGMRTVSYAPPPTPGEIEPW